MNARTAHWDAIAAGDRPRALEVVASLVRDGWSTGRVVRELVAPSQARVGHLWLTGEWTVVQEHCATAVNEAVVHWLTAQLDPPTDDAPTFLVTCLEGERHALPALMVAHDLMERGMRVVFLGADPEPSGMLSAVLGVRPRAVFFSASLTSSLSNQRLFFHSLGTLGIPLVVGGGAFGGPVVGSRRARALGATAYAGNVGEALELLADLPARVPATELPDLGAAEDEAEWLAHYGRRIVPDVLWALGQRHADADTVGNRWPEVSEHVEHVLGCLAAAISLQDESIMLEVHDWLVEVLVHRSVDPGLVDEVWELLADPLQGHPVARVLLAGSRGVRGSGGAVGSEGLHQQRSALVGDAGQHQRRGVVAP